jgi:hypothetical protein
MTSINSKRSMLLFLAVAAAVACSNPVTPPARVQFASSLKANKCANGLFSLTADWQIVPASTKWRAIYVAIKDTTKQTSAFAVGPKTSGCAYTGGKSAYAILDNAATVSDNDATPTIVIK